MALITRFSRLFRADLHAILDRIEEPETLLLQAIREMEEILAEDDQRLKRLHSQQQTLASQIAEYAQTMHDCDTQLDLCFATDKEELARSLVKRKLETQQLAKLAKRKHDEVAQEYAALSTHINDSRNKLSAMKQKATLLRHSDETTPPSWTPTTPTVSSEDIEVAFLQEKQRRAQQ